MQKYKIQDLVKSQLLINNKWVTSSLNKKFETLNPATGKSLMHVEQGGEADIDAAVKAARAAFDHGKWSKMHGADRSAFMHRVADNIEKRIEEIAFIECMDNGKPAPMAKFEILFGARYFRYCATLADKTEGSVLNMRGGYKLGYT